MTPTPPVSDSGPFPLVTVIVPAHNAGKYLRRCLDSILSQTLQDLELVAVNDASTDDTADILSSYSASDPRVHVSTLGMNSGASAARNLGLQVARGEFIAFVDADDYIDPRMCEEMHRVALDLDCDIVSCGLRLIDANGDGMGAVPFPLPPRVRQSRGDMAEILHSGFGSRMVWYTCRNLYRRQLLTEHVIRFNEGLRKGEDSLFNLQALFFANGVTSIEACFYHYRKHNASVTAHSLPDGAENLEALAVGVLDFYHHQGLDHRATDDFYTYFLQSEVASALIQLGGQPNTRRQVAQILSSEAVHKALQTQKLRDLDTSARVRLVLLLAKFRAVSFLTLGLTAHKGMKILFSRFYANH